MRNVMAKVACGLGPCPKLHLFTEGGNSKLEGKVVTVYMPNKTN
jgi:hypothetical protein